MGIIAKQSVKGSIYTYAGAFIGFVNTGILMPKLFATDQIGLLGILLSLTLIISQFANLGFTGVFTRLFPYFRDEGKQHNGILTLGVWVSSGGFLLSMIILFFLKDYLIRSNLEKSALFAENIYYLVPLIFFSIYFLLLDSYNSAIYDAALGVFLRDFLTKLLNLLSIILYYFDLFTFQEFVLIYVATFILPTFIMITILYFRKHLHIVRMNKSLMKQMRHELFYISLFGIISGFSGVALSTIDNVLVNQYLGLELAGIYITCFFFGTLILLPSKVLRKISGIILADAWKTGDMKTISTTYEKSTVTQFIIGMFLFIGLWVNIDNVFSMIPKFASGRYVILFVGLANLVEMFAGVSSMVILSSKHYRMFSFQMLASLILLVGFNMVLIPLMGINGAGLTAIISTFAFALWRFLFIYKRYRIQPYSIKHLKIFGIGITVLGLNYLMPQIDNHYLDFFIRSAAVVIIFSILIYYSRTANDISKIVVTVLNRFRKKS
jgi:O-antigen/teichoic acid export membrane protein